MYSHSDPYEGQRRKRRDPHRALRVAESAAGWLLAVIAICGGVGWLYLLNGSGALTIGPHMSGALPLQELAGEGAQPLARMAVAWLPAGFATGMALALCTQLRETSIAISVGLLGFVVLFAATAGCEALVHNERLVAHLSVAFGRTGLWTATILLIIGSLPAVALAGGLRERRRRAASGAGPRWSSAA